MDRNVIKQKSFSFAIRIVRLNQFLCAEKKEFVLSKQLLRSGTSIGANVYESGRAVSLKDFANKIAIAQKKRKRMRRYIGSNCCMGRIT